MGAPRHWIVVYLWAVLIAMFISCGYAHSRTFGSRFNIRKYTQRKRISKSSDEFRIPRNNRRSTPPLTSTSLASDSGYTDEPDRPFTLPSGEFRPKQSLGQNFLSDQNYVMKIVNELVDNSMEGRSVIEIGPGPGSLTRVLLPKYPKMTAIEIDQRAIKFLNEKLPSLNVIHQDVLTVDWPNIAAERDGPVNIIANLPYHIVSQVLFTLADSHKAINKAIVTTQYEVAERIVAKPSTKEYGILSVVFQLYATPRMNFKIPPTVFYPQPKVDSALVTIDFTKPHPGIYSVDPLYLKKVIHTAFRQRRKMIRASLKELIATDGLSLPEKWAQLRPEQLNPAQFIELTNDLYLNSKVSYSKRMEPVNSSDEATKSNYASEKPHIWRDSKQKDRKQYEL